MKASIKGKERVSPVSGEMDSTLTNIPKHPTPLLDDTKEKERDVEQGPEILSDATESASVSVKQDRYGLDVPFRDYLKDLIKSTKASSSPSDLTAWGKTKAFSYKWGGKYVSKYTGDFVALMGGGGGTIWRGVVQYQTGSIPAYSTLLSDSTNFFGVVGELLRINDKHHKVKEKCESYLIKYDNKIKDAQGKVTTEALIGFQGRSYYKQHLPDAQDWFRYEESVKIAQMVFYGIVLIAQGMCIKWMTETEKEGKSVSDYYSDLWIIISCSLVMRIFNSFMNWSEYFSNRQSAAEKDMEAMGKALQLLENLEANKEKIYKLGAQTTSLDKVKTRVEGEISTLHGKVALKKQEIIKDLDAVKTAERAVPPAQVEIVSQSQNLKKHLMTLWKEEPCVFQQVMREIEAVRGGDVKTDMAREEVKDYIPEKLENPIIERPDGNDLTLDNLFHEWVDNIVEV
jgi:hypothetical protein